MSVLCLGVFTEEDGYSFASGLSVSLLDTENVARNKVDNKEYPKVGKFGFQRVNVSSFVFCDLDTSQFGHTISVH